MQREIGSNFWLNPEEVEYGQAGIEGLNLGIEGRDRVFLSTGRAAITYAIRDARAKKGDKKLAALIPPFTCGTVLQPFLNEGIDTFAYDIDERLDVNAKKLESCIKSACASIVLIHRYFGFDTAGSVPELIENYRTKGVVFIEDRTQNLFSSFGSLPVDYVVGSIRKWGAIPEGGFCVSVQDYLSYPIRPNKADMKLVKAKLKAFQLKYEHMEKGRGDRDGFLNAFRDAEAILDLEKQFYKISGESSHIWNNLNVAELKSRRRGNYRYVYESLRGIGGMNLLTRELGDGVVPLYLALVSAKRNAIQAHLREKAIYAPILWPKPGGCPNISDTAQKLYDQILCLPIDQRYGLDDMERMVKAVKECKG